jgi:hypothetical protein
MLYADDTSAIASNPSSQDFKININKVFVDINEWVKTNLVIKFKKTRLQFKTKNCLENNMTMSYRNKHISNTLNNKFFGLIIDEILSWKCHNDQLVTKLSSACYAVRFIKDLMSQKTLRMIYFSYLHSFMIYGVIFWGNSPHSINIFRIQKCLIRII